jgi:hypothetical protein
LHIIDAVHFVELVERGIFAFYKVAIAFPEYSGKMQLASLVTGAIKTIGPRLIADLARCF